jgi:hypothetical protein
MGLVAAVLNFHDQGETGRVIRVFGPKSLERVFWPLVAPLAQKPVRQAGGFYKRIAEALKCYKRTC